MRKRKWKSLSWLQVLATPWTVHGILQARIHNWATELNWSIRRLVVNTILIFYEPVLQFSSVQSLSQVWLCKTMNHSTPGFPDHHQLPKFTQTHVHPVGDAIQPSHPLSSPSHPAHNPSLHQCLFQQVNSLHEVAKVLEFQLQHQSFQWTPTLISFRMVWLDLLAVQGTLKSLLCLGLS